MGLSKGLGMAALGGGGLGLLSGSGLFGDDNGSALKHLLMEMERKQNMGFVRSHGYQLKGLDALTGGYDKAIANVARVGGASRLDAQQQGQQLTAAAEQAAVNRGLSNTTFATQIPAISAGATQRTLASIDASVAEATANLEAAKGGALNAAYGGLSALSQNYAMQQMMPLQMGFQHAASQPSQFDQLMQLMGGFGGLIGMGLGGGFGGAAGAGAMGMGMQRSYGPGMGYGANMNNFF